VDKNSYNIVGEHRTGNSSVYIVFFLFIVDVFTFCLFLVLFDAIIKKCLNNQNFSQEISILSIQKLWDGLKMAVNNFLIFFGLNCVER